MTDDEGHGQALALDAFIRLLPPATSKLFEMMAEDRGRGVLQFCADVWGDVIEAYIEEHAMARMRDLPAIQEEPAAEPPVFEDGVHVADDGKVTFERTTRIGW